MSNENQTNEAPETQVQETAPVQEAQREQAFDKLSQAEAVKRAIAENREPRTVSDKPTAQESDVPTQKEIKQELAEEVSPPDGFTKEEKEAWKSKDIPAIQKAYRRLDTARLQETSRAQTAERKAREEAAEARKLVDMAAPYIEARGKEGVTPQQALKEALNLVQHFKDKKDDPATIKAELKSIGIDLDRAPGEKKADSSEKDNLLARLEAIERKEDARQFEALGQTFDQVFRELGSEKNRTGESVFPDFLDNSEAGKQLAYDIGSRAFDPKFQERIKLRFPDADLKILVREAYKSLGGRVQGEAARVSQSNQEIEKKKRAALSTPARQASRSDRSGLVGKLSTSAAVKQALKDYREH